MTLASLPLHPSIEIPSIPSNHNTPRDHHLVPSASHRRLSVALPDGGCQITWPEKPAPGTAVTYAASYPGCGARMTWNLVEALTGLWTGDDWNNNGRGRDVVTVKTHYPQSNGILVDFDDDIKRAFVVVRNPLKSIPSFFNHIFEMRNHLPVHSQRAPVDEWVKWRDHYLDIEIDEYKKFMFYWMDRYTPENRLVITYEGLTDDLIGGEVTKSLARFLGEAEGVNPIAEESVPCVWGVVVKNKQPTLPPGPAPKPDQAAAGGAEAEQQKPQSHDGQPSADQQAMEQQQMQEQQESEQQQGMQEQQAMEQQQQEQQMQEQQAMEQQQQQQQMQEQQAMEQQQQQQQQLQEPQMQDQQAMEQQQQQQYQEQQQLQQQQQQQQPDFNSNPFANLPPNAVYFGNSNPNEAAQQQAAIADPNAMANNSPSYQSNPYASQSAVANSYQSQTANSYGAPQQEQQLQQQQQPQELQQQQSPLQSSYGSPSYPESNMQFNSYGGQSSNGYGAQPVSNSYGAPPQEQQQSQQQQQQQQEQQSSSYPAYLVPPQSNSYSQPYNPNPPIQPNFRHRMRRRLDPGHHDSQRKGPDEPRPYTAGQLDKMMNMLMEIAQKYQDDARLHQIMMGYYDKVKKAKEELGPVAGSQ